MASVFVQGPTGVHTLLTPTHPLACRIIYQLPVDGGLNFSRSDGPLCRCVRHNLAFPNGFEPLTFRLGGGRSFLLS